MRAAVALLAIAFASAALGQTPRFRSGVDVVRVDALVSSDGRPLLGLTAADFEIYDDGVRQQIDAVGVGPVPVSMMLLLDTSNSVEGVILERLKDAARAAVDALGVDDRVAVATFGNAVSLRADWTPSSHFIRDAVGEARAGGNTSLYDAAFAALTFTDTVPGNRALIVMFSDGTDTSSWLPARAVLERTRRSEAVVYVVALRRPRQESRLAYRLGVELLPQAASPKGPFVAELAALTGGSVFVAQHPDRLRETFARIVTEFRNRYLITYTPRGVDTSGWHAIQVKVKGRNASIQARRGYSK